MTISINRGYVTFLPLDSATTAWVNAVIANGGTVSDSRKIVVNSLITSLKAAGVWSLLDRLWLYAAENAISARTDLSGLTLASVVGSPTFTADRGYTGTDTGTPATDYLKSGFNPSTNGVNLVRNAAHGSAWCVTNVAAVSSGGGALYGCFDLVTSCGFETYDTHNDGFLYGRCNDDPESPNQGTPASRTGHWIVDRSGASASTIYRNASVFSSPNATSGAPPNAEMYLLASNAGGPADGTPNQIAMTSFGGDLSSITNGIVNFYGALRNYMTTVGVP